MIAAIRSPSLRISVAIALSAMMHAAILLMPYLQLRHEKVNLPPLSVRLEPLPHPVDKPAAKPKKPSRISKPGNGLATKKITPANSMKEMEKSTVVRQFPKHLQLTFTVFRGADISKVGELRHQLDIDGDKYNLRASQQTTGLTSLLKKDRLNQTSRGKISDHGMRPELFREEKISGGGKQNLQATFDWSTQQLSYLIGGHTALPADAQDSLSFMYQLSLLSIRSLHMEFFPLPISDGSQLELHQIEIGTTEDISTPMGKMRALHLRKMHSQGEAYFEIWLGMEYRLLPVKFRQVDSSGNEVEEFVVSDIRAADEP